MPNSYTPYSPIVIQSGNSISSIITNTTDNYEKYVNGDSSTLRALDLDIQSFNSSIKPIARIGATAENINIDETPGKRRFTSEDEKAGWNAMYLDVLKTNFTSGITENFKEPTVTTSTNFQDSLPTITMRSTVEGQLVTNVFTKFLPKINRIAGTYTFIWNGLNWTLNGSNVDLNEYGITVVLNGGTIVTDDEFSVTYVSDDINITELVKRKLYKIPTDMSDLENKIEDPVGSGTYRQQYRQTRAVFQLKSTTEKPITFSSFEDTGDSEYRYTGYVRLNEYLHVFNSIENNNCIYGKELENIGDYTAIVALSQYAASGDVALLSKTSKTSYINGEGYLGIPITMIPSEDLIIESITFMKQRDRVLPNAYQSVSYLKSTGTQYVDTGIDADGYTAEMIVIVNECYANEFSSIVGHEIRAGVYYDSSNSSYKWCVMTDHSITQGSVMNLNTVYYIKFVYGTTYFRLYVNGNLECSADSLSETLLAKRLYLYTGGEHTTRIGMQVYACKLYTENSGLTLRGDYDICINKLTSKGLFYDYISGTAIEPTGGDLIPGVDENLSDYIISGYGSPNNYTTKGVKGQFYKDKLTGIYYQCSEVVNNTYYDWKMAMLNFWYDYEDGLLNPIGGRIFYIHNDNGATYHFYDVNGNELTTHTVEGLANATTYTVEGTPTADKFYVYDTTNGLQSGKQWGKRDILIGTNGDIGYGKTNTNTALSQTGWENNSIFTYIQTCRDNNLGGHNDWFIGSVNELWALKNSNLVDWFTSYDIWSSSEFAGWASSGNLWDHSVGGWKNEYKYVYNYCVAIRSF